MHTKPLTSAESSSDGGPTVVRDSVCHFPVIEPTSPDPLPPTRCLNPDPSLLAPSTSTRGAAAAAVVKDRPPRAATTRGKGSRAGYHRSSVRMLREHARRRTRATFGHDGHPDCVSLETPLRQEQGRPREPPWNTLSRMKNHSSALKATLFCLSEPRGSRTLPQPFAVCIRRRCKRSRFAP